MNKQTFKNAARKTGAAFNARQAAAKQYFTNRKTTPKKKKNNIHQDYKQLSTQFFLGQYLNYKDFDEQLGIYQNDNSYGFCMFATPLNGASEQIATNLMGLFKLRWPQAATLSFCLYSSKELKHKFDIWLDRRKNAENPLIQEIAKNRVEYLKSGINKTLIKNEKLLVRDYRMVVSVTFDGELDEYNRNEVDIFKKTFTSTLNNLGMQPQDMHPDMLLDFMDEIFNRKEGFRDENYKYNPYTPIKNQIIGPSTRILTDKDGVSFNNTIVRGLAVKEYPQQAALAQAMDLIGDILEDNTQPSSQFMFCTNIWFPDLSSLKTKINAKSTRAIQNAESKMAKWVPDFKSKADDWREVTKTLSDGQGLCYFSQAFFTFSELGQSNYSENDLVDVFRSKGWNVVPVSFIEFPVFLSCMPMQFDNDMYGVMDKLSLIRLMPQWNIVNLLPIIGEWAGNSLGDGMMLIGRRGQTMNLDIFKSEGNYNVAIAADSGAGKSFFMNDMIISYLGVGAKIFVIDVGRSYLKLCEVLGGQFISFGNDVKNVCLNPFSGILGGDEEDLEDNLNMIKDIVCQAISPKIALSNLEVTYVGIAVRDAFYSKGVDACFDDVCTLLLNHSEKLVSNLGVQLTPYSKDGVYSRFFNGPANVTFNNQFIVLELEELNMKPQLRSVVLALLMLRISQEMYLSSKSLHKICAIDEAWDLLKAGSSTQAFIETGYRRARKYNGSFITITQRIQDYYANEGATACLTNSGWQFMLKQQPESIDQLKDDSKLSLDDWQMKLIKSIKTRKGQYSEIFVKSQGIATPTRLMVDPYSALVYTTDPKDFQMVEDFKAMGYSTSDAIHQVLRVKKAA